LALNMRIWAISVTSHSTAQFPLYFWRGLVDGGGRNRRTGDCVSVGCVSSHLLWTRPSGGHPVMKFFSTSRAKIAGGPIVAYGHNLPLKRRYDSFGQPTHAVLRLVGSVCTLTSRMSPSQWMGHEGTVTVCFRWLLPLLHG
jgi:hypothetical protein